ncbi:ATP-binding protein [Nocardioides zeae]|uniref:Sensor-like histidine kinase SenX3 n=1 Tax=Nocardioides imazamoxiresistens TaxID=3231893 RepID=A0ABU3PZ47_9ACTN|nr:ATP-binding protein [Nocardioides zeae]MDT9594156.1 ATP-binding protein [Nocardioides zeae]
MDPTTQAFVAALLGALVAGSAAFAWHVSERLQRSPEPEEPRLPTGVAGVLSVLRSSAVVVDENDSVLKASAPTYALGLVRGRDVVDEDLAGLIRDVRRDGQIREREITKTRPGYPTRTVVTRVAPLRGQLVLALIEDRTREHRVEAVRRDFVANVSHELKTPVGAIRLLSDAVVEASDDPEAVERFARRMMKESERLSTLVQQIIELSRLQGDDPLEHADPVVVADVVEAAVDASAIDAQNRDVTVSHATAEDLVVLGNREQIEIAVGNLVKNAITYSPTGATVAVTVRGDDDAVEISVTDQGIGIPATDIDRIFERFYRVDPARHRSTGGTGLGLSIVKHIAAVHGGDVSVWSVEGQGSTFRLRLPRGHDMPHEDVLAERGDREPVDVPGDARDLLHEVPTRPSAQHQPAQQEERP